VAASGTVRLDAVLHLSLSADVTVTGKRTFANLADVENPAENLVGIAQAASQGAITSRQLDERPLMRDGEVLETVPGLIVTQHSGEGKANQYFLRGFNLDHGTDFASTVGGMPITGDEGTTAPSRPSARRGVEWANYYSPKKWLVFDGDVSWSRARFTEFDPVGDYVPEAVGTVVSAGATVDGLHKAFGSIRLRYFGPRTLIEDNSVRSKATTLINLQAGYQVAKSINLAIDVFNLFNVADSDVDYFYTSRLSGEPLGGVADIHTHPTLPRTARVNLVLGF